MYSEIIVSGAIIYLVCLYSKKTTKTNNRIDALLEPLDYSRWKSEKQAQTLDSNDEVQPQGDWWQVQNEILAHVEEDYNKPIALDGKEGYYVGDRKHYDPINYGF